VNLGRPIVTNGDFCDATLPKLLSAGLVTCIFVYMCIFKGQLCLYDSYCPVILNLSLVRAGESGCGGMARSKLAFLRFLAARRQQVRLSGVHAHGPQNGPLFHRLQDVDPPGSIRSHSLHPSIHRTIGK